MLKLDSLPATMALALLVATPGQVSAQPTAAQTKLTLSETATREVGEDTLVATLSARAEGPAVREAQAAVNALMSRALAMAAGVTTVQRSTGGYATFEVRAEDGRRTGWAAEQSLTLVGQDAPVLLELVGTLQAEGLAVNGLDYRLSRAARRAVEDELTAEAVAGLRARAGKVSDVLGLKRVRIDGLRVGSVDEPGSNYRSRSVAMAAEAAAAPPPVAAAGTETVRLSVEAEVTLLAE